MELLPTTHQDFGTSSYWDKFFKKRGAKAFEWYGEYGELCGILHKYIKPADKVLMIGCGNSTLSADLYDVGYKSLVNIDISDVVIRQMSERNAAERPDMKFLKMDMLQMSFEDNEFGVVLDKGTLDALMTDGSAEVIGKVEQMFTEIARVLRLGGRYICISLAQEHILAKVTQHFTELGWPIRVCRVTEEENSDSKEFHMPVFVFVFTKFKKMPNMKPILEVCHFEDQIQRVDAPDQLQQAVKSMQYYGIIRQRLSKQEHLDEHVSLDLYGPSSTFPRYTLYVVDNTTVSSRKFAVFIVPEGRETDWLFSTDAGRKELVSSAGFNRLVIAALHPDHTYKGMEEVKEELSTKVLQLAPHNLGKEQVPFLTLGDDINTRQIRYRGNSDLSGPFIVEDVDVDGETLRRLIFLKHSSLIQSEARLVRDVQNKKKGKTKKKMISDLSRLCEPHHMSMVAGLSLMENCKAKLEAGWTGVLIGLGGGSLASFLHKYFRKLHLEAVELDGAIAKVATEWFGLKCDDRLQVHVQDGVDYITELKKKGCRRDVIILDVDNKDISMGMSSPPPAFIQQDMLRSIDSALTPEGVFILNCSCRDKELRASVLDNLKQVFKAVYVQKIPEYINEVIYAIPSARTTQLDIHAEAALPAEVSDGLCILQGSISEGQAANNVQDLVASLSGLSVC